MNTSVKDIFEGVRRQEEAFRSRIWLEYQYLTLHKSTYKIARECGCDPATIRRWLKRFQIPVRGYSEAGHLNSNHVLLSTEALEFLEGELLGDGSLDYCSKWSSSYRHGSKYEEYPKWISARLKDYGIEQCGKICKSSKFIYSKITGKWYFATGYFYTSRSYVELKLLHSKWYRPATKEEKARRRKFIKIIPQDLGLTSLKCRQWYLGDGRLNHNVKSKYISFATNGFTSSEVYFLVDLLRHEGFKATRCEDNSIHTSTKSVKSLLNFIGPCPEEIKDIYGYKW